MATCANPGCDQPGTNKCSACNTTPYCGSICQTADWVHHKEECPGHLRQVGMAHLEKAMGFERERNWPQAFRHADLAATKLKQMKDHPVEVIDNALRCKCNALGFMGRHREALECAKEWYCLWPTKHTHPPAIEASFALIQSCLYNKEYFDAVLFARTLWETITLSRDSHIPEHQQQPFTARGAVELARSLWQMAVHGDMPPEEQQETGVESIMLARRALEIHTQLYGTESKEVACDVCVLAGVLNYFNDVDDDEVPRLYQRSIAIHAQLQGSLSPNVAAIEKNLGISYYKRAIRAFTSNDLDNCTTNLELALPRLRQAARIYRAINHMDEAGQSAPIADEVEEMLRDVTANKAAAVTSR